MGNCFWPHDLKWLWMRFIIQVQNKWLTTGLQMNTSTFSCFLVGEQHWIPLESVHRQSWWRQNIFVMKYAWCVQHKICHCFSTPNCFQLSVIYEKCMCCSVPENLCAAKLVWLGRNQSADPQGGIIHLHWDAFWFSPNLHYIEYTVVETWSVSHILNAEHSQNTATSYDKSPTV